jgi:hypothetical protein
VLDVIVWGQSNYFQYCQLFLTFSRPNGQKFRPLSKKIYPFVKMPFIKIRQNFEAILVNKSVKIPGFLYFRMEKIKETKHFKNMAPFGPFRENPVKIWPQICPAAFTFGPFSVFRPIIFLC